MWRSIFNEPRNTPRVRCPNTELFLVRIFLHLDWIRRYTSYLPVFSLNTEKYGPEKTPYLDTFTQWISFPRRNIFKTRLSINIANPDKYPKPMTVTEISWTCFFDQFELSHKTYCNFLQLITIFKSWLKWNKTNVVYFNNCDISIHQ